MRRWISATLLLAAGSMPLATGCAPYRPATTARPRPVVEAPEPPPLPKNVPRPELVLVPGDLVRISVHQQADLDLETRIPDNGIISYPLIGPVQAAGRTSPALEQSIRQKLAADYLQSPSVTVTVKEFVKRKVFIVGGVTKPDGYELAPEARMTVLQLVAAAGGFTDKASKDMVHVVRRQGNGERTVMRFSLLEMERLLGQGKADADLELWPDDLVVVPAALRIAYVMGQVQRPGAIDLPNNTKVTVSMAVAQAGSYTKFASLGSLQVLRHSPTGGVRTVLVDLDAILGGRPDLDIEIQPGDVLWVPEVSLF
jgi:polysaccharide export outer membrane protein